MSVFYTAIGRNIRSARNKAGLTQAQMAERLDMSTLHYGRLERGDRNISLEQIVAAAEVLHVPIIELLQGISTDVILTPLPIRSHGPGTIIDFLCAGCSEQARGLMLDLCTLIAQRDKY